MLAIAVMALLACSSVQALDWHPGGALTWTSDYVFRGVSQSNNRPVVQAELHVQPLSPWTLGAWASSVHLLPNSSTIEYNFYLDARWALDQDWVLGMTAVHYAYSNDPRPASYRYDELNLSADWRDLLYLSTSWSPNVRLAAYPLGVYTHQQTLTLEASYHQALSWQLDLRLGAGYYVPLEQRIGDYGFGNAGIARQWRGLHIELAYFLTQTKYRRPFASGPAGGPWTVTASWRF